MDFAGTKVIFKIHCVVGKEWKLPLKLKSKANQRQRSTCKIGFGARIIINGGKETKLKSASDLFIHFSSNGVYKCVSERFSSFLEWKTKKKPKRNKDSPFCIHHPLGAFHLNDALILYIKVIKLFLQRALCRFYFRFFAFVFVFFSIPK